MKHTVIVSVECGADTWEQAVEVVRRRLDGMHCVIQPEGSDTLPPLPSAWLGKEKSEVVECDPQTIEKRRAEIQEVIKRKEEAAINEPMTLNENEEAQERLYLHLRQEADMEDISNEHTHSVAVLENGMTVCRTCGIGLGFHRTGGQLSPKEQALMSGILQAIDNATACDTPAGIYSHGFYQMMSLIFGNQPTEQLRGTVDLVRKQINQTPSVCLHTMVTHRGGGSVCQQCGLVW